MHAIFLVSTVINVCSVAGMFLLSNVAWTCMAVFRFVIIFAMVYSGLYFSKRREVMRFLSFSLFDIVYF